MQERSTAIVVTGIGLVAPLGLSAEAVWARVCRGESGMGPLTEVESVLPAGSTGGQAPALPGDFLPGKPREVRYLRWALDAALANAGLDAGDFAGRRVALMLGTTLHGMRAGGDYLRTGDPSHLSHFLAGATADLASEGLAFDRKLTTCSACSSSLGAVALGVTLLDAGVADVVVAGGYDTISEYAWAGFNALRLVAPDAVRPFARGRAGMKLAEGYGIVVLEREGEREVPPLARVAGYGESADAFHLTKPEPTGRGALGAMQQALRMAQILPQELSLIAAHATGTPDNDASEANAILALGSRCPVVGFKSHLGHTLGGAGAVELILSLLALRDGVVPPTAGVADSDVEYAIPVSTGQAVPADLRYSLNTSLGFGGANTCVVLAKPEIPARTTASQGKRSAVIAGVGVLLPGAVGNEAFRQLLATPGDFATLPRDLAEADLESLINARRARRMSMYVKLCLAAAGLALADAGLSAVDVVNAHALLGTTHGSSIYCSEYYAQIVREGVLAANPMLFAEGVPNAAAAQLSLMLGLQGACQTVIGKRSAAVDALELAHLRIITGVADRVLVVAAEEPHAFVDVAYRTCMGARAKPSMAGSVALIVEASELAAARGAARQAPLPLATPSPSIALPGDIFSVEPLLALAASILRGIQPVLTSEAVARA